MSSAGSPDLAIVPLTPARLDDLGSLFDQGGDPKWCWCTWFRVRGRSFTKADVPANRAMLTKLTDDGPAPGLMAYRDGAAVGWVSLGPRVDFERLAHSTALAPLDDRPVWSIVCFVVGRSARRTGVAHALLGAAIEHARASGAEMLEAYPIDTVGARVPSANAYTGTLSMFERAGFRVAARRQAASNAAPRPIVRLEL